MQQGMGQGRTAQVSAVPRSRLKVSGGTQTCSDLQSSKNNTIILFIDYTYLYTFIIIRFYYLRERERESIRGFKLKTTICYTFYENLLYSTIVSLERTSYRPLVI